MSQAVTPESVARAVIDQLEARRGIDAETHAAQHEFIKMLMDERAERLERRKRMQERIAGSIILTGILAVVGWLGVAAITSLREITK